MTLSSKPIYHRVVLKLSGEFFQGKSSFGLDVDTLNRVSQSIYKVLRANVQMAIVVGGGNFLRGAAFSSQFGIARVTSDQMGMLATVMNGLALLDTFKKNQIPAHIMCSFPISGFVEIYDRYQADRYLESGKVIIFVGGIGGPLFSTDSAAALRSVEIDADALLKATKVDGVFSADPNKDSHARFLPQLTYAEVIEKELGVMDMAAFCICRDHQVPMRVFNIGSEGIIERIVFGSNEGTVIS
jgi:uridylate kinase